MVIELRDIDCRIWQDELEEFVPHRVFDSHTHMFDMRSEASLQTNLPKDEGVFAEYPEASWEILNRLDAQLFPGRQMDRISFGFPTLDCAIDKVNKYVAQQIPAESDSVGLMLVKPEMDAEQLAGQIEEYGLRGLKPYRLFSSTGDVDECSITDFLPESQIEVANRYGLMVMLHLSKTRSIADPKNLADLERLTAKYPRVQWVLAHCGRSYYDGPLLKAADRLKSMDNLWYEISSVCDSDAMDVLLEIAGPRRVMYGSDDIPIGVGRGKYITFGYGWGALTEANHQISLSHCLADMTFTRYESLRAFKRACRRHSYGSDEIDNLFYHNAKRLVELTTS